MIVLAVVLALWLVVRGVRRRRQRRDFEDWMRMMRDEPHDWNPTVTAHGDVVCALCFRMDEDAPQHRKAADA